MIIDNFKLGNGHWAQYDQVNRKTIWTKSGCVWSNIRNRCNPANKWQELSPEYVGCTVSENFKDFQFFAEWHMGRIGFNIAGYTIDKDILVPGNKEYHEHKCILVPQALNNFFIVRPNKDGLPQGISIHKQSGKYRATISSFGKCIHLGLFKDKSKANEAYQNAKALESLTWINLIKDGSVIVDPRVLSRLEKFHLSR